METLEPSLLRAALSPGGYVELRLGLKPHPTQAAVLNALFRGTLPVSFRAANEVGKTSVIGVGAVLYAIDVMNGRVISTAGAWRQVKEQLVPNLKKQAWRFPNWEFLDSSITDDKGVRRYIGFSASDEGSAQGYHADEKTPLLAIIDEAAAVPDAIFNAIEERVNPTWLLIMGSTLGPEGRFYKIETEWRQFYQHFKLTQPECARSKGYWIDDAGIQRKIDKMGIDNPLVRSTIFAEFAVVIEGALLSLAELEACIDNPPHPMGSRTHVFLDFAAGGAENVIGVCQGNTAWIWKAWYDRDTMAAARTFCQELDEIKKHHGLTPSDVDGDADGLGGPVIDRMHELGWKINRFHGGAEPRFRPEDYKNVISEAWGEGAAKVSKREIILKNMRGDQECMSQILNRKCKRNSSGMFELESKADMARRGVASPDRADALFGAMHPNTSGPLRVWVPPPLPSPRSSF